MPTYDRTAQFLRDYARLSEDERKAFRDAVDKFIEDLRNGGRFREGLRVHQVRGETSRKVFEMTWAADGRATFEYGAPVRSGEVHIIWRRVGKHDILP